MRLGELLQFTGAGIAGSVAPQVELRQGIVGRLPRSVQVDLDTEQRDRVIVDQLSDDDDCVDEAAAGDEVPVVVSLGVEAEQFIEAFAERLGDRRELDQQEVARRRLSLGPRVSPS